MSIGLTIALFVLGIALLILEIFVPGGILGLTGIVALLVGIFSAVDSVLEGLFYMIGLLVALGLLLALSFRFPQTQQFWRRITLQARQSNQAGYLAPKPSQDSYLGRVGIALSQLRPAGTADFNGDRLDVVTEGGFIPSGARIKIIAVEGTRVIVREATGLEEK